MEMLRDRRTNRLSGWEKLALVLGSIVLVLALMPSPSWIKTFLIQSGFVATTTVPSEKARQLVNASIQAPINILRAETSLPLIRLDIKYQDWMQLSEDRDRGLTAGAIPGDRRTVTASLYFEQQKYRAKVRLQGDGLDHIANHNRWSLRVHLPKGQAILQTRRFALLSSNVRIHQGPTLFTETLKLADFDIVAPTHTPVRLVVNGEDWGVMLLEQTFSQELLPINKRTEGIIVRLDKDHEFTDDQGQLVRALRPRAVQPGTIQEDPALRRQRTMALTLMSDFLAGKRPASDVFDAEKTGQYLATVDAWGAWHTMTWNNQRWLFNPHTARLEPMQSDVAVVPAPHIWQMQPPSQNYKLFRTILSEPKIAASYRKAIQTLARLDKSGDLSRGLTARENQFRRQLHASSPLVGRFDFSVLSQQIRCLHSEFSTEECRNIPPMDPALHAQLDSVDAILPWDLASEFKAGSNEHLLTITNSQPLPLTIAELRGITRFNEQAELDDERFELPQTLAPGASIALPVATKYPRVMVLAATQGKDIAPFEFSLMADADFLPRPVADDAPPYPFIEATTKGWRVKPGSWLIDRFVRTPDNWQLAIPAGTELSFTSKGGIMVFGQLQISGTATEPVIMKATTPGKNWQGLTLIGQQQTSAISHLQVQDSASSKLGNWQPRGAVYLSDAKLNIDKLSIDKNRSEDALNIVNSQVDIHGLNISNSLSDGFDCDFCRGQLTEGVFTNIGKRSGGDAIDVSGSQLSISQVRFNQVRDKGVSAGEGSKVKISDASFKQVNFGLVAKDASHLEVHTVKFREIGQQALMSFSKKPLFGPATLTANQLECIDFDCRSSAQVGLNSLLQLEGEHLIPQKLDVKQLYRTVMKSDRPQ